MPGVGPHFSEVPPFKYERKKIEELILAPLVVQSAVQSIHSLTLVQIVTCVLHVTLLTKLAPSIARSTVNLYIVLLCVLYFVPLVVHQ